MGSRDNRPVLVPVSFSLPASRVLQAGDAGGALQHVHAARHAEIPVPGLQHGRKTGGFIAMGFSPLWNKDFLDAEALLFGARFRPGRNGLPGWDQDGLSKVVDFTQVLALGRERRRLGGRGVLLAQSSSSPGTSSSPAGRPSLSLRRSPTISPCPKRRGGTSIFAGSPRQT